ncbi:DUF5820 family protein [Halorhabdus utahensis]|uniref:DUF5820 family protein n=1 Tax=Halorhabdus utahensis TaxID=146826 RepID=UPI00019BBC93|nr:DUF5820 family protein [Halorhabdus utahensis]
MTIAELPTGWEVWSEEATRLVLVYRPDIFDTETFPAPCLPTLYVTKGTRDRRPGRPDPDVDDPWHVTLYLEPEVEGENDAFDDRDEALSGALELARAFDAGELDYRSWYQVPRAAYLDRLDELTGRGT